MPKIVFDKPYLGRRKLIELMRERGLIIEDEALAFRALERIGYYRLTGYFLPFQDTKSPLAPHDFHPGARLEDVLALYSFDTELRCLLNQALEKLEVALRTSICEHMCSQYGAHWYTASKSFETGKHTGILEKAANHLDFDLQNDRPYKQINADKKSRQLFLDHYYDKYDDPKMPAAWMLREIASFGFWAQVYEALQPRDRRQVANLWRHPDGQRIDDELLLSWLWSISILRNRCAHHTRITNRNFPFAPKLPDKNPSKDLFYSKTDDLRTLLVIVFILTRSANPEFDLRGKLLSLFQVFSSVNIEDATGFSMESKNDWKETSFWTLVN